VTVLEVLYLFILVQIYHVVEGRIVFFPCLLGDTVFASYCPMNDLNLITKILLMMKIPPIIRISQSKLKFESFLG